MFEIARCIFCLCLLPWAFRAYWRALLGPEVSNEWLWRLLVLVVCALGVIAR